MNNNSYHEAGLKVLNWKRLSINMMARYGHWKALSDSTWTPKWKVVVLQRGGQKLKQVCSYPFGSVQDAETCRQWWLENNCYATIIQLEE